MLVLGMSEHSGGDDDIILRDAATGRIICEITLVEVRGSKARLGYAAPDDVEVNRRAIDQKKHPAG